MLVISILTMDGTANSDTKCPTGLVVIFKNFSSSSFFILFCLFQGRFIPIEKFLNSVLDFDRMMPSEGMEFGHVNEFSRGPVRLGRVENYLSTEADSTTYKFT